MTIALIVLGLLVVTYIVLHVLAVRALKRGQKERELFYRAIYKRE